jgi:serine/threonine protein kinase
MEHLDDNVASEFVSGALLPSALTKVEGHLAKCRECRTLVAALAADSANDSNAATFPHEKLSPSQVTMRPTRTLTVGDRVGRYLVLTTLGTGGMGVVFAAYDPQLDRKVALKLLRAGITYNTKDARTRLRREAQAIAQLSHPNVVNVYDVGETDDGDLYIAMEFVEGDTLTTWLKAYPRTWREIVDVFLQAARGVIAAHSVGLLHRDFKPDNVLVGHDARVRVTDFGLARSLMTPDDHRAQAPGVSTALNVDLTATGTVLGTPRYMAPEQLTGTDIDARADQFAFCVALYEALYGVHPLPGATSVAMLEKNQPANGPPEGTKVPAAIAKVVKRGLERDRAKRFPSMAALIAELVPPPPPPRVRYAVAAFAGLAVVAAASFAMLRRPERVDEPAKIDPLIEELNKSESERRLLLTQLAVMTKESTTSRGELAVLRRKLVAKDEEIQKLVDKVTELTTPGKPVKPAKPVPSQAVQVTFAVSQADNELEGCFVEWNERLAGDADMLVKLTVTGEGRGHSSTATGPDSPFLRLCVAEAIERVKYPPGPEVIDLEVNIQWSAGLLNLAARVVGRRPGPGSILDL